MSGYLLAAVMDSDTFGKRSRWLISLSLVFSWKTSAYKCAHLQHFVPKRVTDMYRQSNYEQTENNSKLQMGKEKNRSLSFSNLLISLLTHMHIWKIWCGQIIISIEWLPGLGVNDRHSLYLQEHCVDTIDVVSISTYVLLNNIPPSNKPCKYWLSLLNTYNINMWLRKNILKYDTV